MLIKVDDTVEVIQGDDKGKTGKVLRVDRETGRVLVEGVNRVYKHVRRSQRNPNGGRLSKEMPVNVSNVMLIADGERTRLGVRYLPDGTKERYAKRTGKSLGAISPPRAKYAKK